MQTLACGNAQSFRLEIARGMQDRVGNSASGKVIIAYALAHVRSKHASARTAGVVPEQRFGVRVRYFG